MSLPKTVIRDALVLGAVICLILCVASCSRREDNAVQAKSSTQQPVPVVAVARAATQDMSRQISLTAEFRPFQEVDVMAKVSGYVKKIPVDVGDHVQQGQLLAEIEIPEQADDLARTKAVMDHSEAEVKRAADEVQRAESAHEVAHLTYTRLAEVAKQRPGLVAQQEVDDAHAKDLVTEAQVNAAKSGQNSALEQTHVSAADITHVHTMMNYTRVTAPFTGVITKRYADLGSLLQAGTSSNTQVLPVVKLSENNLLRLTLPVPESAVSTIHVGQTVDVKVPALNRSFPGRVARFSDKVAPGTRTMDTELDVPNASYALIPGMYAEVVLTLEKRANVLAVPTQAVDFGSEETMGKVVVINAQNQIETRNVELGLQSSGSVEIRSGVREGEMVVVGSRSALRPGEQVQPKVTSTGTSN